ncbi:MAG: Gfo/Idh/MocA family oxidoreductase [Candidatus Paceibacterota bacterium]
MEYNLIHKNNKHKEGKLKAGIIGLGHQSVEDHIPALKQCNDVDFVSVADTDLEKLEEFKIENPSIHTYLSYEEMFKKEKLDFIILALPHYLHFEATKRAIFHKINVLKEKPFTTSLAQARELKKLAIKNKIEISITLQRRFNPIYTTFNQFFDKIGSPFFFESKYTFYTNEPHSGWRGQKKLAGGGCLIDMGYHLLDLLLWYFGLPDGVIAESSCKAKENIIYDAEDTIALLFDYHHKGFFGSALISRSISPKQEYLNVFGTRGSIHLERGKIERMSPDGIVQESLQREQGWPSAAYDQIDYFIKVIRGQKPNINGPESHFKHLAVIEAVYLSQKKGCYIDPHKILKNKHE